ncbi:hypothetical protein KFK09_013544 [Dendrobium nobile]|uniref:Integrase catalytic domain-containing protein n=1 Tax=Dendrobium nobile TaxID=94219 RepID=A0A8T3BDB9_DENNO|nr:hypothetical protein KFK09_013544 [Dendrobium nobile]
MATPIISQSAESSSDVTPVNTEQVRNSPDDIVIPSSLKFLISNIKTIVPIQLSNDNYATWRSQIWKLFRANNYSSFLDQTTVIPSRTIIDSTGTSIINEAYCRWVLADQNLAAAICSTISASILPYVLNLDNCADIWSTLERRLQATNRSRVIQLKNELHHITMGQQTMLQYLTNIKTLVDNIAAAGSPIDNEDILLYTLNGLPPQYQAFKTSIRTTLTPVALEDLYSLLLSEEINLSTDLAKEQSNPNTQTALYTNRSRGRGRGRSNSFSRGRNTSNNQPNSSSNQNTSTAPVFCQICGKRRHTANICWHRFNANYTTPSTALTASNTQIPSDWILDTRASSHFTNNLDNIQQPSEYNGSDNVSIGDGRSIPIAHSGQGLLPTPTRNLSLFKLLHTPNLAYNLLSVSSLTKDNNLSIVFDASGFCIKDKQNNRTLLSGPCNRGLYRLSNTGTKPQALSATTTSSTRWHRRLGHPHQQIISTISKHNRNLGIPTTIVSCSMCKATKGHKLPFPTSSSHNYKPLELIHMDVWGPSPITSNQGFRYYIAFIDDFTRFTWVYPLRFKSDVFSIFSAFHVAIEKQYALPIKIIRSDGGTEFLNFKFQQHLRNHGIQHQISCPYTPEQNGLVERKHRHIIETTRTLLHTAHIPLHFWLDTLLTAVYLINIMPSSNTMHTSPYQLLHNRPPNYSHLRVFGCACYPLLPSNSRHKLSLKSPQYVFLGYATSYKGYKCLNPTTGRIFISRHVTFEEDLFPFVVSSPIPTTNSSQLHSNPHLLIPTSTIPAHTINTNLPNQHNISTPPQPLPHSIQDDHTSQSITNTITEIPNTTLPVPPPPSHSMVTRSKTGSLKPKTIFNLIHTTKPITTDPTSYTEASKHSHWRTAMANEFLALQQQGTWCLVPPPIDTLILGSRWTYKTKKNSDGSISSYKARLVAQGHRQEYGLHYKETFSPVAKFPTIRILLTIAFTNSWHIHQLDIANAFLHGSLNDTVYMKQPRGFEDTQYPKHVCLLKKIPLRPKAGTSPMDANHTYLLIYVDDILITGSNSSSLLQLISSLKTQFAVKHLGSPNTFLGIQITHHPNYLFLSQSNYISKLLEQTGLSKCNVISNPSTTKPPVDTPTDFLSTNSTHYRQITGSLQYATITRPDIAFAVNTLCQHMHSPLLQHFLLLKRLLRYLKGTKDFGLPIFKTNPKLTTFVDADWASDPHTRRSTSGFCTYLGNNLISWTVKKQQTVARSSTEAEYRSLASAAADVIWLRRILSDFQISLQEPTVLHCDNTSAIALANNPVFHARTKHIEVDCHFIRDHIQRGEIFVAPINTTDQTADILTKPLVTPRFIALRSKLTVQEPSSVCGGVITHQPMDSRKDKTEQVYG